MPGKGTGNKDAAMAAHLKAHGIPHGRRTTSTAATHNYPRPSDPAGSAKMQRRPEKAS